MRHYATLVLSSLLALVFFVGTNLLKLNPNLFFKASTGGHPREPNNTYSARSGPLNPLNVYLCGYGVHPLAHILFPEYSTIINWEEQEAHLAINSNSTTNNSKNVLIHGMQGSCRHSPKDFPGKVLFVNGESAGDETNNSPKFYQIGGVPDSNKSVMVYYAAVVTATTAWNFTWDSLVSATERPKSSGKYHAISYVSRNCVFFREIAIRQISKIMPVHYGSSCYGGKKALGVTVMPARSSLFDKGWAQLPEFYKDYKFCFVMENTKVRYYITEKIMTAFIAGCIPVYYGTEEAFDVFNKDAFIYYDVKHPNKALKRIKYLATNDTTYWEAINTQPILADGWKTVHDYFSLSENVGDGYLWKKIREKMLS